MSKLTDEDKQGIREIMQILEPHIVGAVSEALMNADRSREAAYELKHFGKEYLQNMPDPRFMDRMMWQSAYTCVLNACLASPGMVGSRKNISRVAVDYSDLAVEAYNKRFPQ